jgi:ATP-dependent Clp protease ATP-binding subunit ClpA
LDCAALFELLDQWFDDLNDDAISSCQLRDEIQSLFDDNTQVVFVRHLRQYGLSAENEMIAAFFCNRLVNNNDDDIRFNQLSDLFENSRDYNNAKAELRSAQHTLMKKKLVEHICEDGIADTSKYHLTADAQRDLLAELNINPVEETLAGTLKLSDLTPKKMFYPQEVKKQVDELSKLFQQEEFQKIQERMKEKGFRNGFACLFYGGPGTGKTETVYQLALQTGRSIMIVDVPQIKSKWVGDSEKNIKALFDRYREVVKRSKLAPILLFNEADAIIGKRQEGAERAVEKMENSIQNIILQEMENLDGIMIATTNLQQNMDTAFERRFLYKIKFEKPSAEARASIWRTMIPELSDFEVNTLASKYDFSGGQIENIARHYAIDSILHDLNEDALSMLFRHCDNERLDSKEKRPIGFACRKL